jgi:hypothetical protein
VLTNVGHKLLRKLATRIKLSEISHNSSPNKVVATPTSVVVVVVVFGRIEVNVECVFERSNGFRNIACEFVELLVNDGRFFVVVVVVVGL